MMFIDKMVSDVLMKYDTNLHCNVCKTDASYKELLQSEYVYPCKNFKIRCMKTGVQKIRHFQKLELNTPWQKFENYLELCYVSLIW